MLFVISALSLPGVQGQCPCIGSKSPKFRTKPFRWIELFKIVREKRLTPIRKYCEYHPVSVFTMYVAFNLDILCFNQIYSTLRLFFCFQFLFVCSNYHRLFAIVQFVLPCFLQNLFLFLIPYQLSLYFAF